MIFSHIPKRVMQFVRGVDPVLWGILMLAFLLRVVAIPYGLPLMVVADEPPFVLAALAMLQTHTLIPALNPEAFLSVLYYPPYISYLYLIPFAIAVGVKFLLWHGTSTLFASYLLSDLSVFFEIARAIMLLLGLISIYFMYEVAHSVYKTKAAAQITAFLIATSVLHTSLSAVGRHWLPVSFLFALVLYILTREKVSSLKRLCASVLIAGFGVGVSTVSFLTLIPIALWFFTLSGITLRRAILSRAVWVCGVIAVVLAAVPSFLYSGSQGALMGGFSLFEHKTILEFLISPFAAISQTIYSEPLLIVLFATGVTSLWFVNRRWCLFAIGFFISYVAAFYILFGFQPRFMLPLVLLYSLCAPALYLVISRYRIARIIFIITLLLPLSIAVRFSYLAFHNDTRVMAREWVAAYVAPNEKILAYGELLRLPTNAAGVAALRAADPAAVRKVDLASEELNDPKAPASLNLYAVENELFFKNLPTYITQNSYSYLIIDPNYVSDPEQSAAFKLVENKGTLVAEFKGLGEYTSIADTSFIEPFWRLFEAKNLGPTIEIYSLK